MRRRPKVLNLAKTFTLLDQLMAPADATFDAAQRDQLMKPLRDALDSIAQDEAPTADAWDFCTDAYNLIDTVVTMGLAEDPDNLRRDANLALTAAAMRSNAGGHIRLDGPGIVAMRALLRDFSEILEGLSQRAVIAVHRETVRRISAVVTGRKPAPYITINEA